VAIVEEPTLLGVSAIIASCGGILSTMIGARRARREEHEKADEECRQRLAAARQEAEALAAELHTRRMRDFDESE